MSSLVPIRLTREVERLEHRYPMFRSCVPGQVVYVTPSTLDSFGKEQDAQGCRLYEPTGDPTPYRPYQRGESLDGLKVGYVCDGRLGDAMIASSVWRQLVWDHPGMELHAYVHSVSVQSHTVVRYNRDIEWGAARYWSGLLRADELAAMDRWIVSPNVGALYRGADDRTQYELLEEWLGFEIEVKRPHVWIAPEERDAISGPVGMLGRGVPAWWSSTIVSPDGQQGATPPVSLFDGNAVICQLDASERERTPSIEVWSDVCRKIRQARPRDPIVVIGTNESTMRLRIAIGAEVPGIVFISCTPTKALPYLTPYGTMVVIESAGLVITPDSFSMHAAAAFDRPCIAIWQDDPDVIEGARIPSPESRVKHYSTVQAIGMSEVVDRIGALCMSEVVNG